MRTFFLLVSATLVTGCGTMTYSPVQEASINQLVNDGCTRRGDRFSVTGQVNSSSRETIVLWDGRDGSRTVAVRLPKQGFGSRLQDRIGDSRYNLAFEQLSTLSSTGAPVTLTMRCEGAGMAPMADRFSYFENGQRIQYEF